MEGMFELIDKGGNLMYVILFCSVVAVGVALERLISLKRSGTDSAALLDELGVVINSGNIQKAIEICEKTPGPTGRICKSGLMRYDRSREEIREAIEDSANYEIPFLERYLGVLSTIATITPLVGLLGTVSGMISVFKSIEERTQLGGVIGPEVMAGGIWSALITTAAGLSVAIPTFVAYNFLVSRSEALVHDMEQSATDLVNIISTKKGY